MLEELNSQELKVAMKIAELNHNCGRIDCDDCLYTGEDCNKEANDLLAELLKAEIKRRETVANRRKLTLEVNVEGKEHLDKVIKAAKKLKSQQNNKTYRSKVTTESAVVETTVDGLSFEEIKVLVNGE